MAGKEKEYSTSEVAEMYGVSMTTVRDWIDKGELRARRLSPLPGSRYLIPQSAIDDFNARLREASGGQREDETDPPRRNG